MFIRMNKKSLLFILVIYLMFLSPKTTLAQGAVSVDTAFGAVAASPEGIATKVLMVGSQLAGGLAFLLMIYSGFLFLTSAGDPHKLQEATDVLTSAIAGLLLVIFSVFLLDLLGVQLLNL